MATPPLIVHVIVQFDVGGLENGIVNLVNQIPESRYRQAIVCLTEYTDFRNRLNSSKVPIIALHKKDGKDPGAYVRLWKILRRLRPDIVHTRNLGTVDAVVPAVLAGVPQRIHGEHGWDIVDLHGWNRRYRWLRRVCGLFTTRHITVSRHLAEWLESSIGVPAEKIVQIYNGVDTEKFTPATGDRAVLGHGNFAPHDAVVIGTVGRMAAVKNPLLLARAFLELVAKAGDDRRKLRLVMVGDGPLQAEVQRVLADADAADLAWLPGKRDDVAEILQGIDIFVMPSLNEGISNTILEAMATGLPVVATHVGGNPELVSPDRTGLLVEPENSAALADGIGTYLAQPGLIAEHGDAARREVEEKFSLESMVQQYLAVYDSVSGGAARVRSG